MSYLYSVLRFVPDPGRGECVNIGAIVGSEEAGEWELRTVENLTRARRLDHSGVLSALMSYVNTIGSQIDDYQESVESNLPLPGVEISEEWMTRLWEESQNVVQLSRPTPIEADNLQHALHMVFDEFVVEVERRRFPFTKKIVATAAIRKRYRAGGLVKGADFLEKTVVQGEHHRESFDFVVRNGQAVQLAQAWSFQVPDKLLLTESIKAWAWTVRDVRHHGGYAVLEAGGQLSVPPDVEVAVAYVPPHADEREGQGVLQEALSAFNELKVIALPHDQAGEIGGSALKLLGRP